MAEEKQKADVDKLAIKDEMITLKPSITCTDGHKFIYKSGIEVMCTQCPLGYQISSDMQVRDGHIYAGETLLI